LCGVGLVHHILLMEFFVEEFQVELGFDLGLEGRFQLFGQQVLPVNAFKKRVLLCLLQGQPLLRIFVEKTLQKTFEVFTEVVFLDKLLVHNLVLHLLVICPLEWRVSHYNLIEATAQTPHIHAEIIALLFAGKYFRS